jgi:hypothetical protein
LADYENFAGGVGHRFYRVPLGSTGFPGVQFYRGSAGFC